MIKSYREYRGWDVFYAATDALAWTARREFPDGGHKLRADTWEGIKRQIDFEEDEFSPEEAAYRRSRFAATRRRAQLIREGKLKADPTLPIGIKKEGS